MDTPDQGAVAALGEKQALIPEHTPGFLSFSRVFDQKQSRGVVQVLPVRTPSRAGSLPRLPAFTQIPCGSEPAREEARSDIN